MLVQPVATLPAATQDGGLEGAFVGSHASAHASAHLAALHAGYLETLTLVERLHRLLLDVIKDEFERLSILEVNPVQALLVFNIGEAELTAGELKTRGYYQGSNVSYNLKRLVEMGYMHHQRSEVDRRSVLVRRCRGSLCRT